MSSAIIHGGGGNAAEPIWLQYFAVREVVIQRFLIVKSHQVGSLPVWRRMQLTYLARRRLRQRVIQKLERYASPYSLY